MHERFGDLRAGTLRLRIKVRSDKPHCVYDVQPAVLRARQLRYSSHKHGGLLLETVEEAFAMRSDSIRLVTVLLKPEKAGNKVMNCLKRALIADACQAQVKNLYLFAIILNKYLYYFSIEAEFVS